MICKWTYLLTLHLLLLSADGTQLIKDPPRGAQELAAKDPELCQFFIEKQQNGKAKRKEFSRFIKKRNLEDRGGRCRRRTRSTN